MRPASPVIPGEDLAETVFGGTQDQYENLPAWVNDSPGGEILTRWRLTWMDRLRLLWTGNIYVWVMTFGDPPQPINVLSEKPEVEAK